MFITKKNVTVKAGNNTVSTPRHSSSYVAQTFAETFSTFIDLQDFYCHFYSLKHIRISCNKCEQGFVLKYYRFGEKKEKVKFLLKCPKCGRIIWSLIEEHPKQYSEEELLSVIKKLLKGVSIDEADLAVSNAKSAG